MMFLFELWLQTNTETVYLPNIWISHTFIYDAQVIECLGILLWVKHEVDVMRLIWQRLSSLKHCDLFDESQKGLLVSGLLTNLQITYLVTIICSLK